MTKNNKNNNISINTKKKNSLSKVKKSIKKNNIIKKGEYYLIHNNGGRSFVVVIKNKSLKVYKRIWDNEIYEIINPNKLLKFRDYTNTRKDKEYIIYTSIELSLIHI